VFRSSPTLARAAALLAVLAAFAPPARAEDELLDSIYTESGYELRSDDRLFVLFCALNAAGFERAESSRELPFPKRVFHPIRRKVRDALGTVADSAKSRDAIEKFLDAHPAPLERYVEAALALGDAPEFTPGEGFPGELAGLDRLLRDFARSIKLEKVTKYFALDSRAELKRLRDVADGPFVRLRKAYRLDEETAAPLVLLPNAMDGAEGVFAVRAADGSHVVVVGLSAPDRPLDLAPALRAYSHFLAKEAVGSLEFAAVADAVEQLRAQSLLPAGVSDARSLVLLSLRAAAESKFFALDPAAALEARFREGLVLARDFAKALEEPAEAYPEEKGPFVQQVAGRFDPKKSLGELFKAAPRK
jgi:hypothetical protein